MIRLRALVQLSWVVPLDALGFLLFKFLSAWFTGPGVLLLPAALAVPLVITLTELASGIAFAQLSQHWDALAGGQRGVLGTAIALFAGVPPGGAGLYRHEVPRLAVACGLPATGPPKAPARVAAQLELDERPADELRDELPNYDS